MALGSIPGDDQDFSFFSFAFFFQTPLGEKVSSSFYEWAELDNSSDNVGQSHYKNEIVILPDNVMPNNATISSDKLCCPHSIVYYYDLLFLLGWHHNAIAYSVYIGS